MVTPSRLAPSGHPELTADRLHASLSEPVLDAMNFLNEIALRHPNAISLAAGAPHEEFFADIDVPRFLDLFERHLAERRGLDAAQRRRLLYQYGPARGIIADLIAAALRRDEAIDVPERAIVVTVGCQEAIFLTLRVLYRGRGTVAVWGPAYAGVIGAARLLGLDVTQVDGDSLERAAAQAQEAGRELRALYVAPDFANPTGERLSLPERQELLAAAERLDLILLEDSTYGFTAPGGEVLPTLKALDRQRRVVHLGTFAKTAIPGARVGFAVADQPVSRGDAPVSRGDKPVSRGDIPLRGGDAPARLLAEEIAAAKTMVTVNTSPIAQAVIGGMILAHHGSLKWLGQNKSARYRANLSHLLSAMEHHLAPLRDVDDRIWWNTPSGGFFVRMRLPIPVDDDLLELSARKHRVLWTPMRMFHIGRGGDYEMRLSCSALDEEQIGEGVRRIRALIEDVVTGF